VVAVPAGSVGPPLVQTARDGNRNICSSGGAHFVVQVTSAVVAHTTDAMVANAASPSSPHRDRDQGRGRGAATSSSPTPWLHHGDDHPGGVNETSVRRVEDCGDGQYIARFTPVAPGLHYVAVLLHKRHIAGSPFRMRVALPAIAPLDPSQCVVAGAGVDGAVANREATFSIKVRSPRASNAPTHHSRVPQCMH